MEDQIIEPKEFHPMADQLKKVAETFKKEPEVKQETEAKAEVVEDKTPVSEESPKAEAVPAQEETDDKKEKSDDLNEPEFSFGEPEAQSESTPTPADYLKKIGGALDFGELKDEQELVTKVNALRSEIDKYKKEAEVPYEGLPAVLKDAVEAAKMGADWYSLMGASVDYSKVDPIQAFEYEYEMQLKHRYQAEDGSINYEKLDADLDAIPESEKIMRGNDIIRQKAAEQNAIRNNILAQAEYRQHEFNNKLADSSRNVSKFFPKERYGVSFEQKHTDYIREGIISRNLIKKHLGSIDESVLTGLDTDKLARTIAAAEMVGNISEFRYKQGQVDKARELLAKNTNAQVETSAIPARPNVVGERQLTPQERLAKYHEQFRGAGRL
jgi:hypothetical protein